MHDRRVVVTGVGVVSPLGSSKETLWPALCAGKSGVRQIVGFDTTGFDVTIAAQVTDFDPAAHFPVREVYRLDRFSQFALVAAGQAIKDSGLDMSKEDPRRIGCIVGTGIGGLDSIETEHKKLIRSGHRRVSALMIPKLMGNAAAGQVSIRHGLKGPSFSCSSACASGTNAIGEAMLAVRNGFCDMAVTGGSEAAVTQMGVTGFMNMRALSTRNDAPEKASRPFDKDRDGFVIAEGAGILVIEELEHARRRGAHILAELLGYAATSDACDLVRPEPTGRGAVEAMHAGLADAQCSADDINYINAHGTSTPAGDDIEAKAICQVFGERARRIPVSSTKSMVGHLLGASGALESLVCVWTLQHQVITPTINLDTPDPECQGLDFVPHTAREARVTHAMNNSFGFGGHNVGLIFGKFEG